MSRRSKAPQLLALTVANLVARDVTSDAATIGVDVIETNGFDPNVSIYWGDEDGGSNIRGWDRSANLGVRSVGQHLTTLANLNAGTDYHYRTFALTLADGVQTWASATSTFTTTTLPSARATLGAIDVVGDSSALINGSIDGDGSLESAIVHYGRIDGGDDPQAWEHRLELAAADGSFSTLVTGLLPATDYSIRLAATNVGGTVWSDVQLIRTADAPPLRINEVMPANASTLPTRVRLLANDLFAGPANTHDWFEIQNATDRDADLSSYYLSDTVAQPLKWQLPAGTVIPARGAIVVFASSLDVKDPLLDEQGKLHTNFSLDRDGEIVLLATANGTIVHQLAADQLSASSDVSLGYFGSEFGPLGKPSPASSNGPVVASIAQPEHVFTTPTDTASPLVVTARIHRASAEIAAVQLVYRAMFDDERTVVMTDDGMGADRAAGDDVYSGAIPGGIAQPGQMIRYRLTVLDNHGVESRMPRHLSSDNSPQYFGTMVDNPGIDSPLPVLHRFIQDPPRGNGCGHSRFDLL